MEITLKERLSKILIKYSQDEIKNFWYEIKINYKSTISYQWYRLNELLCGFELLNNNSLEYTNNLIIQHNNVALNKIVKLDDMGMSYIVWDREKDLENKKPIPKLETGMFVELTKMECSKGYDDYLIGVVVNDKIIFQDGSYDFINTFHTVPDEYGNESYYLNIFSAKEGLCFDVIRERTEGTNTRNPIWEGKVYWY